MNNHGKNLLKLDNKTSNSNIITLQFKGDSKRIIRNDMVRIFPLILLVKMLQKLTDQRHFSSSLNDQIESFLQRTKSLNFASTFSTKFEDFVQKRYFIVNLTLIGVLTNVKTNCCHGSAIQCNQQKQTESLTSAKIFPKPLPWYSFGIFVWTKTYVSPFNSYSIVASDVSNFMENLESSGMSTTKSLFTWKYFPPACMAALTCLAMNLVNTGN